MTVFGIRPGEGRMVAWYGAYVGVVIGEITVGRTARDTLFLNLAGKDSLPFAYVASALATIFVAWAYAGLSARFARGPLNTLCACVSGAILAALYVASDGAGKFFAYTLYVSTEAIGALLIMQAWSLVHDALDVRQGKRMLGLIGAGGQVAAIVGALAASALVQVGGVEWLLLLGAACALSAAALAWKLGKTARATHDASLDVGQRRPVASTLAAQMADPHLRSIALITVLTGVTVYLVDFQFKSAATVHNAGDPIALGVFFARFQAICAAVGLLIQLGLTSRLLQRLGTLGSALPLPIALGAATAASIFVPGLAAVAAAKAADSVFRYSLNDAATELLYLPVPARRRAAAKAMIAGILRPSTGVFAGLALPFAAAAGGEHGGLAIASVVLVLVVAWCVAVIRGRRRYLEALAAAIGQRISADRNGTGGGTHGGALADGETKNPRSIAAALAKRGPVETRAALFDERPHVRAGAVLALMRDGGLDGIVAAADDLRRFIESDDDDERALAAVVLGELRVPSLAPSLLELLATPSHRVRRAAVIAIGAHRDPQLGEALLPLMPDDEIVVDTVRALAAIGDEAQLGRALMREHVSFGGRLRIAAALSNGSSERALPPLMEALAGRTSSSVTDSGLIDSGVRRAAIFGLWRLRERAPASAIGADRLGQALSEEIERAELLLHVRSTLPSWQRRAAEEALTRVIDDEVDRACACAMRVLALLHPGRGFEALPRALAAGSSGRANAIEILDATLDGPRKARLIPILEARRAAVAPLVARTPAEWLAFLVTDPAPALARAAADLARAAPSPRQRGPLVRGLASPRAVVRAAANDALEALARDGSFSEGR